MRILAIIPAYNEEESLASTVDEFVAAQTGCDYLVVNDGSSDGTERVCLSTASPYKFSADVLQALGEVTDGMNGFACMDALERLSGTAAPEQLSGLRAGEVVTTVDAHGVTGQELANMMIGRELQQSQYEKKDVEAGAVISLQNIDYHKESKHAGLNDVSLSIGRGEIVGIAGVDGNGQTQLAQLLTGVLSPESGEFQRKGQKIAVFSPRASIEDDVALIPEDRNLQGLIGNMSIADNLVLKQTDEPQFSSLHGLHMKKKTISAYAREMIGKYDIRCQSSDQEVRNLSGGNQQKVILARELESDPDVLIAVHPTRGLDIGATRFVHDQMIAARDRGVGILLISADFDEILEMSDRILVIFEGQIMGEYSGKNPPIEEISLAMTGK